METFAERLKYYRQKAGYSQKELAEKIGIKFAAYNNYETKGAQPKYDILLKLAYALNCSANDLVGYEPPKSDDTILKELATWGIKVTPGDNSSYSFSYEDLPEVYGTIDQVKSIYKIVQDNKFKLIEPFMNDKMARHFMVAMLFTTN